MKSFLASCLTAFVLVVQPGVSAAQSSPLPTPTCAWQFAWTPFGLANWLWPDTANRWWCMPIDPQWKEPTVTGEYPKGRFFSLAVHDDAPVSTGLAARLYDAQIVPDAGSGNPFAATGQRYTITVARSAGLTGNVLRLNAETRWLPYRLYLPNAGEGSMGGVPLPDVRITDASGRSTPLPTCRFINRQSEGVKVQQAILPLALETPPRQPPVPDHLWFNAVKSPSPVLLPNPDSKYLVSFFMPEYEPDRLVMIRGKMPGFPDAYRGSSVWDPAPRVAAGDHRLAAVG